MIANLHIALLAIVVVMSMVAGVAKVNQMPYEVEFFVAAGLGVGMVAPFGALQLIGGFLMLFKKYRVVGASISCVTFLALSVAIGLAGEIGFAIISLSAVLLSCALVYMERRFTVGESGTAP